MENHTGKLRMHRLESNRAVPRMEERRDTVGVRTGPGAGRALFHL